MNNDYGISITKQQKETAKNKLNSINSIAIILEALYKPIDDLKKLRNCSNEEAIKHKETADNYLKNYGILTLKENVRQLKEILDIKDESR